MKPTPIDWPLTFRIYKILTTVAQPFLTNYVAKKHATMGGAPDRLEERFGKPTLPRPKGKLIWFNAASLGELRAALPIMECLTDIQILLTTTSQSAADLADETLPPNAFHQFAPIDTPKAMSSFLNHWRPDLAVFLESDLPLNGIEKLALEGVPLAALNVRASTTRDRFPKVFSAAFSRFSLVAAQDRTTARELQNFGVEGDRLAGVTDLKSHAPAPVADAAAVAALKKSIGARPCWLAMSAHPQEADMLVAAHRRIRASHPDALLILAPRHPEKAREFLPHLEGFQVSQRSGGALPDGAIYLADTLGEAGALFAVAQVAFIGGTFAPIGGHSPQEALKSGKPVLFGPHNAHHAEAFGRAQAVGAGRLVEDADALADGVLFWLDETNRMASEKAVRSLANSSDEIVRIIANGLKQVMA